MLNVHSYSKHVVHERAPHGLRANMKPNPDDSLTIYIQAKTPGKEKETNWLPAPKAGPFKLAMHLYSPRESVRNGNWVPPAVVGVD